MSAHLQKCHEQVQAEAHSCRILEDPPGVNYFKCVQHVLDNMIMVKRLRCDCVCVIPLMQMREV